jgi:hypothetical protein
MTSKKLLIGIFLSFIYFHLMLSSVPVKAESYIPEYSDQIEQNNVFIYNVSAFGTPSSWYNYDTQSSESWETSESGQIKINITGFYQRHENDWGDDFPDENMPYMDIKIYKSKGNLNYTRNNCSNAEASSNLILGYWPFNPGFVIPKNISYIKDLANQSSQNNNFNYIVEESYNFLYFYIEDSSELIYDKSTGLLVYANTHSGSYNLEINLLNFSLDLTQLYHYNVSEFGDIPAWWYVYTDEGYFQTNEGGLIEINFTGYYNRPSSDWGDVFPDTNMAYMNVMIYNKTDFGLSLNFSQVNVSNKEVAVALALGYNNFQSGFLVPSIQNLTNIKKLALQEATGFISGVVKLQETDLTLKIIFEENEDGQKNNLIYEKRTGLLLWTRCIGSNYKLEMTIDDYDPWTLTESVTPSRFNLDQYVPYILIGSLSIISIIGILVISQFQSNVKEYNKYIIIAIIGLASFTSLIYFGFTYSPHPENEKSETVQNISLTIDYGNGTLYNQENFRLTNYKTSAFDAVNTWADVQFTDYGAQGYLIESIDGIEGNWLYYVNEEYISVAANKYYLQDGDQIRFEIQ